MLHPPKTAVNRCSGRHDVPGWEAWFIGAVAVVVCAVVLRYWLRYAKRATADDANPGGSRPPTAPAWRRLNSANRFDPRTPFEPLHQHLNQDFRLKGYSQCARGRGVCRATLARS